MRPCGRARLHAAYVMLGHGAIAAVTAPSMAALRAGDDAVRAWLLAGRPAWTGPEVVAVSEVWEVWA
jgi:hypothetical protein